MTTSFEMGKNGEDIAFNVLKRALGCEIEIPKSDKGIDAIVQFKPPYNDINLLFFGIQVKTGFSYVKKDKKGWKIRNIKRDDLIKWKENDMPIMLLWVHPEKKNQVYWHLVNLHTNNKNLLIPKMRYIRPSLRYELPLFLLHLKKPVVMKRFELFIPQLTEGIRTAAKDKYKTMMVNPDILKDQYSEKAPVNPLTGPVRITWHGWRHITHQKRRKRNIFSTLQLLPVLYWAIENPIKPPKIRRFSLKKSGNWYTETKLLIFTTTANILGRGHLTIVYVIRETINFHEDWVGIPNSKIKRSAIFESLYELNQKKP